MIITTIVCILFSNALNTRKDKSVFYSRIAMLMIISAIIVCYNNLFTVNFDKGIGLFGGTFNMTSVSQTFSIFVLIITSIILIYNSFFSTWINFNLLFSHIKNELIPVNIKSHKNNILYLNKNYNNYLYENLFIKKKLFKQYSIMEYPLIILFTILGSIFLMSSGDLISLFISIELQSYGLYILCSLYRDSEKSTQGGLTYFLLGGLSSCFILLGSALIYINSGSTSLDGIYIINSITEISLSAESNYTIKDFLVINNFNTNFYSPAITYSYYYVNFSLMILSVGFLFKISAAPFHFWSPDVYDSIPTVVTTTVAIVAKLSLLVILLELIYYINKDYSVYSWKYCVLISSLFSLIIGSILGLTQYRIKRVYAYSTISHVGFILLALCIDKMESIQSYLFYIIVYTISNLNAFIILLSIGYTMYFHLYKDEIINNSVIEISSSKNKEFAYLKDVNDSPIQLVNQLKGYFYINSYLSLSLSITLFSFIGIPPLIGFFAKQMVLSAALDNGFIFMTLVGILTSVIGAVYYLNIVKQMFFFKSNYIKNTNYSNVTLSSALSIIISILTLFILLFMFIPNESFNVAKILTLTIFN